jgi:hypothetical protein
MRVFGAGSGEKEAGLSTAETGLLFIAADGEVSVTLRGEGMD